MWGDSKGSVWPKERAPVSAFKEPVRLRPTQNDDVEPPLTSKGKKVRMVRDERRMRGDGLFNAAWAATFALLAAQLGLAIWMLG